MLEIGANSPRREGEPNGLVEIAEHLGVSQDTIHRWIRTKNMPAHKVGRLWKFDVDEVNAWVKSGKAKG